MWTGIGIQPIQWLGDIQLPAELLCQRAWWMNVIGLMMSCATMHFISGAGTAVQGGGFSSRPPPCPSSVRHWRGITVLCVPL